MDLKKIRTIAITAAVTFSATTIVWQYKYHGFNFTGDSTSLRGKAEAVEAYVKNNYFYGNVDYKKANDAAIKAYIAALDEPYTKYYTDTEFKAFMQKIEESYTGIGVVIAADEKSGKICVLYALENSPADEAGIVGGEYIVSVDGEKFDAQTVDECISKIKDGKDGTSVKVTFERDGEQFEKDLERREIMENSVSGEMFENNIGYLHISNFNTDHNSSGIGTYEQFTKRIEELKEQGMEKLIIDLRNNPGGVLSVACNIADYILPEGIITYTIDKTGKKVEYKSDKKELNIPIVVLINKNSASASEVLTGALKDYGRATVVGEKSYGKGIVQSVFTFSDGSGLSMTVSKYYTPSGECIHEKGINPDYTVELPEKYSGYSVFLLPHDEDTQLKKAIELLNE